MVFSLKIMLKYYQIYLLEVNGGEMLRRTDFIGAIFLVSGVLLLGLVHLAIAIYVPSMAGWSDPPGKFNQAREEVMVNFPYFLSIGFILAGIIFLFIKKIIHFYNYLFKDEE